VTDPYDKFYHSNIKDSLQFVFFVKKKSNFIIFFKELLKNVIFLFTYTGFITKLP